MDKKYNKKTLPIILTHKIENDLLNLLIGITNNKRECLNISFSEMYVMDVMMK